MAAKKSKTPNTGRDTVEALSARLERARSGAAGVHVDQQARRQSPGTYRTNRVRSRSAARRAAVEDQR